MNARREHENLIITIEKKQANQTLRAFLQNFHLSKKKIHELYMDKKIRLNGDIPNFEQRLMPGDQLAIPIFEPEAIDFIPQKMNLDILYEDDHLLILNKPAGIMVHPDEKTGQNTLVNGVAYYYQTQGIHQRIRYIHRLDTDTSGGIIFAKNYLVHSLLDYRLAQKDIHRWYFAFVGGNLRQKSGKIDAPIGRDRHHNLRRRVAKHGDSALTYYQVKKQYKSYALVELKLQTGRTHQIRVHMSHLGHPLLGDTLYGGRAIPNLRGQALHSARIKLEHPITKQLLTLEAPLPPLLKQWL